MAQLDARLRDFLEPLRNHGVGGMLQALALSIAEYGDVESEPVLRGEDGAVRRTGPLMLPRRSDLAVGTGSAMELRDCDSGSLESFEPITLVAEGGYTTVIAPFAWERAEMLVEMRPVEPDWRPLRLWYLEAFQVGLGDVGPELGGCVHALDGPEETPRGWRLTVDFGSAPTTAVGGLIAAIGQSGALRLRIGQGT